MTEANNDQETAEVLGTPAASTLKTEVPKTLKDPEGFKKMFNKSGRIKVRGFIDNTKENMGLENYGMTVFPGTHHEEQLAAIERNGVVRYVTGLDEFAPDVQNIVDPEEKKAVITNIRNIVVHLEKLLATNVLDPEDEHFWNKVKMLKPDNHEFWGKISIRCGNEPVNLDPAKDPYDLIKYMAIEAGGFDIIAKSFEDGMSQPVTPKFYLDKEVDTISTRTSFKKLRNKAIGLLDNVSDKNPRKLLYIAKVIDSNSISYKLHTASDILYDAMDDFINGLGVESNKTRAAEHFIKIASLDMETLKLKAIVRDAAFLKVISLKADGVLYHSDSSTMLGKNVSDVVLYLKNPINEDLLIKIIDEVEVYWKS